MRIQRRLRRGHVRFAELFGTITKEDAQSLIAHWVTEERAALSIVWPRGEGRV